jgi:hypothetical protein
LEGGGSRCRGAHLELFVEDHLGQLLLDLAQRQVHQARDVGGLDARVRLDDAADVLLQEHVVEGGELRRDDRVCP